jgi:hypothetical protein
MTVSPFVLSPFLSNLVVILDLPFAVTHEILASTHSSCTTLWYVPWSLHLAVLYGYPTAARVMFFF